MSRCDCEKKIERGLSFVVRPCGCTGDRNEPVTVTRVFRHRAWVDRAIDVARCAKDMGRRRFWRNELHLPGCPEIT